MFQSLPVDGHTGVAPGYLKCAAIPDRCSHHSIFESWAQHGTVRSDYRHLGECEWAMGPDGGGGGRGGGAESTVAYTRKDKKNDTARAG